MPQPEVTPPNLPAQNLLALGLKLGSDTHWAAVTSHSPGNNPPHCFWTRLQRGTRSPRTEPWCRLCRRTARLEQGLNAERSREVMRTLQEHYRCTHFTDKNAEGSPRSHRQRGARWGAHPGSFITHTPNPTPAVPAKRASIPEPPPLAPELPGSAPPAPPSAYHFPPTLIPPGLPRHPPTVTKGGPVESSVYPMGVSRSCPGHGPLTHDAS